MVAQYLLNVTFEFGKKKNAVSRIRECFIRCPDTSIQICLKEKKTRCASVFFNPRLGVWIFDETLLIVYLTIIPRARMGSKSKWAIDREAMRARGIIVLVKSKVVGPKYRDKTT